MICTTLKRGPGTTSNLKWKARTTTLSFNIVLPFQPHTSSACSWKCNHDTFEESWSIMASKTPPATFQNRSLEQWSSPIILNVWYWLSHSECWHPGVLNRRKEDAPYASEQDVLSAGIPYALRPGQSSPRAQSIRCAACWSTWESNPCPICDGREGVAMDRCSFSLFP